MSTKAPEQAEEMVSLHPIYCDCDRCTSQAKRKINHMPECMCRVCAGMKRAASTKAPQEK